MDLHLIIDLVLCHRTHSLPIKFFSFFFISWLCFKIDRYIEGDLFVNPKNDINYVNQSTFLFSKWTVEMGDVYGVFSFSIF